MKTEDLMQRLLELDLRDPGFQGEWERLRATWQQRPSPEPSAVYANILLELMTSGHTEQALFDWVCRFLVRVCQEVDCVIVGEYLPHSNRVYVRSAYSPEGPMNPFTYSLKGTPCQEVLASQSACIYHSEVAELFPGDSLLSDLHIEGYMGTPLRDKSGQTLGILVALSTQTIQQENHLTTIFEATCARVSAEMERLLSDERLKRRERLAVKEQRVMEQVLNDAPLDDVLAEIVAMIEAEDPAIMGSILLHDVENGVVRHGAANRLPEAFSAAVDGESIGPQTGSCGTAIYRKEEVIVTDIGEDALWENFRDLALNHGLQACWSVPVFGKNQLALGSFAMYLGEPGAPSQSHLELLRRAAALTGVIITYYQNHQALQVSERQFRQLFERNHAVMLLINPETGALVASNQAAQHFYGYASQEMQQLKVWDLNVLGEAEVRAKMREVEDLTTFRLRFQHRLRSGEIREVEVNSGPVETPQGVYLYSIIQDITEQVLAEQALKSLNQHLEARVEERTKALAVANRELEAFTYAVSHDLRAPLRTINGFAGLLRRQVEASTEEEGLAYLRLIEEGAMQMNERISGLLELSRCTVGQLTQHQVRLSVMAEEIVERLRLEEPDQLVEEISIEPQLITLGDPRMLNALLDNLLSNAWKYAQLGQPRRIQFGLTETEKGPTYFVKDNGIGFDMKDHERLFEPFQRLVGATDYPGIGIGLATVQRIVKRHQGTIWAESEPGRGTTFYFTLRLEGE